MDKIFNLIHWSYATMGSFNWKCILSEGIKRDKKNQGTVSAEGASVDSCLYV